MELSLKEIADLISGKVVGDENVKIRGISTLEDAKNGDITFLSNKKYVKFLKNTQASAVIVGNEYDVQIPQVVVSDPYLGFAKVVNIFSKKEVKFTGVSERAFVSSSAIIPEKITIMPGVFIGDDVKIGEGTVIYPNVYIGERCKIGKNCIIYPNVSIYADTVIGDNVIIHAGTVVGSDGFGYAKDGDKYFKIPQIGNVVIEDDVEIGANCTIDRGALKSTVIGKGTKIDNLVQIAHNVVIGKNCAIVAQVGISGSVKIGDNVILAGQVGVAGHITIGNNVMVGAQSGVGSSLKDGEIVSGSPAVDHRKWQKWAVSYHRLPELIKKVRELEKRIDKGKENDEDR